MEIVSIIIEIMLLVLIRQFRSKSLKEDMNLIQVLTSVD